MFRNFFTFMANPTKLKLVKTTQRQYFYICTDNINKTASNQLSRNCNIIFLMGKNTQFGNYLTKLLKELFTCGLFLYDSDGLKKS